LRSQNRPFGGRGFFWSSSCSRSFSISSIICAQTDRRHPRPLRDCPPRNPRRNLRRPLVPPLLPLLPLPFDLPELLVQLHVLGLVRRELGFRVARALGEEQRALVRLPRTTHALRVRVFALN
jgi:hypothetical protein